MGVWERPSGAAEPRFFRDDCLPGHTAPNEALHVIGLPDFATCADVSSLVSRHGHAKRISLYWGPAREGPWRMRDAVVTLNKPGSVADIVARFESPWERRACADLAGFLGVSGSTVDVLPAAFAAKKLEDTAVGEGTTFPNTACVAGLPVSATRASVLSLFGGFGRIRRLSTHWDESCGGAVYALVTWAEPSSVTEAARQFNGTRPPGGSGPVLTVEPASLKRDWLLRWTVSQPSLPPE